MQRKKVFISYKREESPRQERRDEIVNIFREQRPQYDPIFDQVTLTPGKPWRDELKKAIEDCDCILVLWHEFSEWVLVEATMGECLNKPLIFICYENAASPNWRLPPKPFQHLHVETIAEADRHNAAFTNTMVKILRAVDSAIDPQPLDQPLIKVKDPQQDVYKAIRNDLEQHPGPAARRKRIENLFSNQLTSQQLQSLELAAVNRFITELETQPIEPGRVSETDRQYLYDLGSYLGELHGLNPITALTAPLSAATSANRFKAMYYLVTRGLYKQFAEANRLSIPPIDDTEYYLPYRLSDDSSEWAEDIASFTQWMGRTYFNYAKVSIPTYEQWLILAEPDDEWGAPRLVKCNLKVPGVTKTDVSAVGVFQQSQSRYGCFDVIGNVWELCRVNDEEKVPSRIVGWSHQDRVTDVRRGWNKWRPLTGATRSPIGFRLVVTG